MNVPGTSQLIHHADGRFETRPIPLPPARTPAEFKGKSDEYAAYMMLLRGIALDVCRTDAERTQAFTQLLAVEKGLWTNRLANEGIPRR